jgi:hypothetical protein
MDVLFELPRGNNDPYRIHFVPYDHQINTYRSGARSMHKLLQQLSRWEHLWRRQNLMYWAFAWGALALCTFMFFGGSPQSTDRPLWYRFFTVYILQNVPFVIAGLLCVRNGLSRRMPSGSQVWLLMGVSLIAYLVGNIFFASWDLVWHLNSTGCLGDPFFCLSYVGLSLAMGLAIYNKRSQFKPAHWMISGGISIYAAMGLFWILQAPSASVAATVPAPPAIVSTDRSSTASTEATDLAANNAPKLPEPVSEPKSDAPEWVMFFDGVFKPYGSTLNIFYVCCDLFLFTLSLAMILAFWGGRFTNAWQVNAQAIMCLYIADMWYAYAGNQIKDYQPGFLIEACWTLSGIQFAVAAAIEFESMLAKQKQAAAEDSSFLN